MPGNGWGSPGQNLQPDRRRQLRSWCKSEWRLVGVSLGRHGRVSQQPTPTSGYLSPSQEIRCLGSTPFSPFNPNRLKQFDVKSGPNLASSDRHHLASVCRPTVFLICLIHGPVIAPPAHWSHSRLYFSVYCWIKPSHFSWFRGYIVASVAQLSQTQTVFEHISTGSRKSCS